VLLDQDVELRMATILLTTSDPFDDCVGHGTHVAATIGDSDLKIEFKVATCDAKIDTFFNYI
jgi:hypothetical protein